MHRLHQTIKRLQRHHYHVISITSGNDRIISIRHHSIEYCLEAISRITERYHFHLFNLYTYQYNYSNARQLWQSDRSRL
jgi:hypothetical protein